MKSAKFFRTPLKKEKKDYTGYMVNKVDDDDDDDDDADDDDDDDFRDKKCN